ncbi:MAG: EscU/YscU/HrcU family type III secretion system export apparatus switch protein [Myxococcales bacterium]|nr:EscU/YscU/HrcU family type III secretion system export apparatus switch protein [Myxococcales bacterium]
MSADASDKTDFLSARRLKEAWDTGKIPIGKDASGVAAMMAACCTLLVLAPQLKQALISLTHQSLLLVPSAPLSELLRFLMRPLGLLLLALAAAALAASAVTFAQTRGGLWADLVLPDPERVVRNPFQRTFSKEFLVDLALMSVKVVAVGTVAALAVRDDLLGLPRLLTATPEAQLTAVFAPLGRLAVRTVAVLAVFAGVDLALTHWRFREKLKMTKEEAKREMKEDEGDPLLKGKRKKRARELAKGRLAVDVPKADAVVVNPTHIAVALRYRQEEGRAPRVIAKGKGEVAERIRELARAHGIPIVEDIALARLLYKRVKLGKAIPAETYRAVAAVLAFVYRVTGRRASQSAAAAPRAAA